MSDKRELFVLVELEGREQKFFIPVPKGVNAKILVESFSNLLPLILRSYVHQDVNPRTESAEIKKDYFAALAISHRFRKERDAAKERAQNTGPHTNTKIQSNGFFESGKMSGPMNWEEKVCTKCGKVVAITHDSVETTWVSTLEE